MSKKTQSIILPILLADFFDKWKVLQRCMSDEYQTNPSLKRYLSSRSKETIEAERALSLVAIAMNEIMQEKFDVSNVSTNQEGLPNSKNNSCSASRRMHKKRT